MCKLKAWSINKYSGFPIDTNCAPIIADVFIYCYERDYMSDLHNSKLYDIIDMLKYLSIH